MRGRKPILHPLGDVVDLPISAARVPEAPDHLTELGRKCWDEMAAILVAKNIYDVDCKHMLAAFCVQYGRFLEADAKVQEQGLIIHNKKDGHGNGLGQHSGYLSVSNNAYDRMVKLGAELGLTPVSRKRVQRNRGIGKGFLSGKQGKAKASEG